MRNKIFTIATAHLDTVWNWPFEKTCSTYIKKTLVDNFALMEKYPDYRFNFEGAYRYELMEEYYPELFERLKKYVAEGRWYPCGSSYENGDVNVPSAEALFRNILLGNGYFDKQFGIRSKDIYLPDCFGFGWALPAIMRHAGLKGFCTQKLSWGCSYGIPFDLGKWYGCNGDWVYGSLNSGNYTGTFKAIRDFEFIRKKLEKNKEYRLHATVSYHGTGDTGGAPKEESVITLEREMAENATSDTEVISARSDEVFDYLDTLTDVDLPTHDKELTLIYHGVGSYTSRSIGKRWNKRNEILGDVCERANLLAEVLGVKEYPREKITTHWKRFIAHQFHDDITGTSLQKVYERSWNDYMVSLNGFSDEYNSASSAIVSLMDTRGEGVAVVVNNPLEFSRTVAVRVRIPIEARYVTVSGKDGVVPSQIENGVVLFSAKVDGLSYETFSVLPADEPYPSNLTITKQKLENEKYVVTMDKNGDICSVFDKFIQKELLQKPIRHDIFRYIGDKEYPAWTITYPVCNTVKPEHSSFVSSEIVENGAARITLKVVQAYRKSKFTSWISLTAGGELVEVRCEVDWRSYRRLLKHDFCFTASNQEATYDLGIGTVRRGNNTKKMYEFVGQNWADLTDKDHAYGVSVLSECKYGWDKPDDNTLRLTAIHTPFYNFRTFDSVQSKMDIGLNRYGFALYSHTGAAGKETQQQGRAFVTPAPSFLPDAHEGILGKSYSFGKLSDDGVSLIALKKAENTEEIIARFYENEKKNHDAVCFTLGKGILSAREMLASEEEIGKATVENESLLFSMKPYEVKTFALTVAKEKSKEIRQKTLPVEGSDSCVTSNAACGTVTLPNAAFSLPQELWKDKITCGGIKFDLDGVAVAKGQTITLPEGATKVYILACGLRGEKDYSFGVGEKIQTKNILANNDKIGIWDLIGMKKTARIRNDIVAWEITHTHNKKGDMYGKQFFVFRYEFDVNGQKTFRLPDDKNLFIFGATAVFDKSICTPTDYLYDQVTPRKFNYTDCLIQRISEYMRIKYHSKYEG